MTSGGSQTVRFIFFRKNEKAVLRLHHVAKIKIFCRKVWVLCHCVRLLERFPFFGNKKTYWMAAQKSRVFHWKDQHFDFSLQFCYSKMHCFREYLQTTGKSVCLPHLIRLGCEAAAGAAAAALRGRRSWRTSCGSGCSPIRTLRHPLSGNAVRGSCATGVVQSLCSTELCLLGECELEGTIRCSAPVVVVYSVPISPSDFLGMEVQHSVRMV